MAPSGVAAATPTCGEASWYVVAAMTPFLLRRLAADPATVFFVSVLTLRPAAAVAWRPGLGTRGRGRRPGGDRLPAPEIPPRSAAAAALCAVGRGVVHGDLGESIRIKAPVVDLVIEKLPGHGELALLALVIALAIGGAGRDHRAVRKHYRGRLHPRRWRHCGACRSRISWLGILMISCCFRWNWGGCPPRALSAPGGEPEAEPADAGDARLRARQRDRRGHRCAIPAVRCCRCSAPTTSVPRGAKGLSEKRVILRHALRNALVPVVTLGALEFGRAVCRARC